MYEHILQKGYNTRSSILDANNDNKMRENKELNRIVWHPS